MPRLLFAFLVMLAAPASAAVEWRQAQDIELVLESFDIEPSTIRLAAGEPVRLRLINRARGDASFSAEGFFRSATMRRRDQEIADGGTIRVGAGETKEIVLVPAPGRYDMKSGSLIRSLFGMRGDIIVE